MILLNNGFPPRTPALWYVTNGDTVVGPVGTDLLLRGITSARIPDDCMVIQESWGEWRSLSKSASCRLSARSLAWSEGSAASPRVPAELVEKASDAGEALLFAMHAAVTAVRATGGLVHRHQGALRGSRDFVGARRR